MYRISEFLRKFTSILTVLPITVVNTVLRKRDRAGPKEGNSGQLRPKRPPRVPPVNCEHEGCREVVTEDSRQVFFRYGKIPTVVCRDHFKILQAGEELARKYQCEAVFVDGNPDERIEKIRVEAAKEFLRIGHW